MQLPATFEDLIEEANRLHLYKKLIFQLNKDFQRANIDLGFHEDVVPTSLILILQEAIYKLIQDKFPEFLNLLYIIDVPENQVKALDGEDVPELAEKVAFLILKREWQKVWFRYKL